MLLRLTVRCLSKHPTRIAETGNWPFSNIRIKTLQIRFIMLRKCLGWATRAPIQLQLTVVTMKSSLTASCLCSMTVTFQWFKLFRTCTLYVLHLMSHHWRRGKSQTIKVKLALVHETFVPRVCNLMSQTWLTAWNKDLETEIWPQTKRCWMKQTASNFPSEKVWRANCLLLRLSIRFWLYSRSIWAVV